MEAIPRQRLARRDVDPVGGGEDLPQREHRNRDGHGDRGLAKSVKDASETQKRGEPHESGVLGLHRDAGEESGEHEPREPTTS